MADMIDPRRVTVTEPGGIKDHPYYPAQDDSITVPGDYADRWIQLGWAADASTGETGERKPGAVAVSVNDVVQPSS